MIVTTDLECGNGRLLRASPELIEVELIAYSKGSRYTFFRISNVEAARKQEVVLRPDSHFRVTTFPYKKFAEVWVRYDEGEWTAVRQIERTPEAVRFWVNLRPGQVCDISTEPPRPYTTTAGELFAYQQLQPELATLYSPGASSEGRLLLVLRVTNKRWKAAPGKELVPVIHVVCGEHATEFSGEEIGRGMLEYLLSPEGEGLRDRFVFDFVLNANPDGNVHGWHQYNARDWREHNYSDAVDRSWHHEYVPYILDQPGVYSPETAALMGWLKQTRPALYLSMHSWEGHEGNPGSFYTALEHLSPGMARAMEAMNRIAVASAQEGGFKFDAIPTSNRGPSPHLGHLLMERDVALAYLPEGNYAVGRAALQQLGVRLITRWLEDPAIEIGSYGRERWECLFHGLGTQTLDLRNARY